MREDAFEPADDARPAPLVIHALSAAYCGAWLIWATKLKATMQLPPWRRAALLDLKAHWLFERAVMVDQGHYPWRTLR